MFSVDFAFAIAVYLGIILLITFICWIIGEKRVKTLSAENEKEFIWQCEICAYAYVDSKNSAISMCPRCKSYNERKKI